MMDPELETLLQEVLDGTATAEQQAKLEARIRANPAGADRRRELEHVFRRLNEMPSVEAPAGLREAVLRELDVLSRLQRRHERPGTWRFAPRTLARLALSFAFGIAVGAIGFAAWTGPTRGPAGPVTGAMMPDATASIEIRPGGGSARIRGESSGGRQVLHVVATPGVDAIELSFDPAAVQPASVRNEAPGRGTVEMSPGRIVVLPEPGVGFTIELLYRGAGAPVAVTVRGPAGVVERTLPAGFGTGP